MCRVSDIEGGRGASIDAALVLERGSEYWSCRAEECSHLVYARVRREAGSEVKISYAMYCFSCQIRFVMFLVSYESKV